MFTINDVVSIKRCMNQCNMLTSIGRRIVLAEKNQKFVRSKLQIALYPFSPRHHVTNGRDSNKKLNLEKQREITFKTYSMKKIYIRQLKNKKKTFMLKYWDSQYTLGLLKVYIHKKNYEQSVLKKRWINMRKTKSIRRPKKTEPKKCKITPTRITTSLDIKPSEYRKKHTHRTVRIWYMSLPVNS